jgi:hypothetical protein
MPKQSGDQIVPIEAWLLFHKHPEVCEETWEKGLVNKREPYTKGLFKQRLYGVQRPTADVRKNLRQQAIAEVRPRIHELRSRFPNGFGRFFDEVLTWKSLR